MFLCEFLSHYGINSTKTVIHFVEKSNFVSTIITSLEDIQTPDYSHFKNFYQSTAHFFKYFRQLIFCYKTKIINHIWIILFLNGGWIVFVSSKNPFCKTIWIYYTKSNLVNFEKCLIQRSSKSFWFTMVNYTLSSKLIKLLLIFTISCFFHGFLQKIWLFMQAVTLNASKQSYQKIL